MLDLYLKIILYHVLNVVKIFELLSKVKNHNGDQIPILLEEAHLTTTSQPPTPVHVKYEEDSRGDRSLDRPLFDLV